MQSMNAYPDKKIINFISLKIARGELAEVVEIINNLIKEYPFSAEVQNIAGLFTEKQNEIKNALHFYNKAVNLDPNNSDFLNNKGRTLGKLGDYVLAIECFDKAILIGSDKIEYLVNKAVVLKKTNKINRALDLYLEVYKRDSNNAIVAFNISNTYLELGQYVDSLEYINKAIKLNPKYHNAYYNRAKIYTDMGLLEKAIEDYEYVIELNSYLSIDSLSNILFIMNYSLSFDNKDYIKKLNEYKNKVLSTYDIRKFKNYSKVSNKLKIGFISGDLNDHPVGYFLEGWLSKFKSDFIELYAYSVNSRTTKLTKRIRPFFDIFYEASQLSHEELANKIYEDKISILIDLSGHTGFNRLPVFLYKPSPIQLTWLGYFASTGLNEIDYVIADNNLITSDNKFDFVENIWNFPNSRWCFTSPGEVKTLEPPSKKNGYVTFGCFSNMTKVNDEVLNLWLDIINITPNSKILFKSKQLRDDKFATEFTGRLSEIGYKAGSYEFDSFNKERSSYLDSYNKVDIILDTFPFTGGTTSMECLWMGVPFVTLSGRSMVGRQGVGILNSCNLNKLIAKSKEEYILIANNIANDLEYLVKLRKNLRNQIRKMPIYNVDEFAKNFEIEMLKIWEKHKI